MPEEGLETPELKEQIEQGVERALEEHERETPRWTKYLSLSTAIIAVFAAVASLESGANANDAILEKNEAVLNQSKTSDQWAYYQAKSVKAAIAAGQAELAGEAKPEAVARLRESAERYKKDQEEIERKARELEEKVKESGERAEKFLERHHRFALSVTLFQIAIAMCAIAALTRQKALWLAGLLASGVGIALFMRGFLAAV